MLTLVGYHKVVVPIRDPAHMVNVVEVVTCAVEDSIGAVIARTDRVEGIVASADRLFHTHSNSFHLLCRPSVFLSFHVLSCDVASAMMLSRLLLTLAAEIRVIESDDRVGKGNDEFGELIEGAILLLAR